MEWFGRAKIDFIHSPSPRELLQKDGTKTSLLEIVESATPPCHLNPLLFNGHLQTIWTATRPAGPSIYYKRRLFDADHKTYDGTFAVDFVVDPYEGHDKSLGRRTTYFTEDEFSKIGSDDSRPMLVVMHGLSGGSHEVYLRHCIAPLVNDGRWEVCVVNSRGCAYSKITSGVLYNARATWDIRQVVKWLRKTFPNRPLFGLGFSLGANMLTNYCGEEGSNCQLKGAVVCSNPFNLEICSKVMQESFFAKEVYLRAMGTAMKELIVTHRKELEQYAKIDIDKVMKITYLHEWDREVQCSTWGYPTEYAYYRDATCSDALLSIKIPFLAVQALDDAIALKAALPFEEIRQNPNTVMLTTSLGGHLCWFETGGGRWFPKPVSNFLNHLAFKTDLGALRPHPDSGVGLTLSRGTAFTPMRRKLCIDEHKENGVEV